jgi:predicted amidohydrolase YtcJ
MAQLDEAGFQVKVHAVGDGSVRATLDGYETGSIETGKWADMIVLNHNLLEIPVTEIHKTEVQKTLFKGKVVYPAD